MKYLKNIFSFYINASIHVALAVYALACITAQYLDISSNDNLNYFIFFGTITGYNFIKYAGIAKLHHRSLTENLKIIQIFSFISFLLMLLYASKLRVETLLVFFPLGIITLLYAVPILNGLTKNLRNVGALKIILIALVWAITTVLLPVIDKGIAINSIIILQLIQRMLLVVVLMIPFDIRDLKYDHKNLQTLPQILGVERVKKFGFILLALTILLEFFITTNSQFKTAFLLLFFNLLFMLQRAKRKQTKYYASFWVEAIPIIWMLILFVINNK